MSSNIEDTDLVFYCTKCLALDIRTDNGITYCHNCYTRKTPKTIDITTFDRWEELYLEKYGNPLVERKTPYDDIREAFNDEAIETITELDAINNNLVVREKMNLNIDRLRE